MTSTLQRPAPYRCSDRDSFAENTLLIRLPEIARRVTLENRFSGLVNQRIQALLGEMPDSPIRPLIDPGAPDLARWDRQIEARSGSTWRALTFLECEHYFYRRVLEATRYFQPGPNLLLDPYREQKQMGLDSAGEAILQLVDRLDLWRGASLTLRDSLHQAIEGSLWGNRADLSLWPAGAVNTLATDQLHQAKEFILVDHLEQVVMHLSELKDSQKAIHFLIDNAGFELVYDLALADLFLSRGVGGKVHFHLKRHPTFVSDALIKDVFVTISALMENAVVPIKEFGLRLRGYLGSRRLILWDDFYWNAPLAFWYLPANLETIFHGAGLVISKGDANYRRLMGDLRWPEDTPFDQVVGYFNAPLLALRVSKCELTVGLAAGQAAHQDSIEADWRTNGRWGYIQFRK